jgi:RecB family exonuclease
MITLLRDLLERLRPSRRSSPPAATPRRWHSVSSTREYEGCPRRYRFGYRDKRPQDRPVPATWRFGSVVHEGLEAAYRVAMDQPELPRSERLAAATDAVHASWDRYELGADEHGRQRAVWHVTRALTKDVLRLDEGRIVGVEMAFRGRFSEQDRLAGFADLVLERPDGTIELVDHKVTRYRTTPEQLREDFQLNLYGELARLRWPAVPRIVATHHYPTGPAAVSVELGADGMSAAHARVRAAAAAIEQDRTFAPTPSERCDHCPWLPSCTEGAVYVRTRSETAGTGGRDR